MPAYNVHTRPWDPSISNDSANPLKFQDPIEQPGGFVIIDELTFLAFLKSLRKANRSSSIGGVDGLSVWIVRISGLDVWAWGRLGSLLRPCLSATFANLSWRIKDSGGWWDLPSRNTIKESNSLSYRRIFLFSKIMSKHIPSLTISPTLDVYFA